MKVILQLIAYLDGNGLLDDGERLRLWQGGYLPDVVFDDAEPRPCDPSTLPPGDWIESYALDERRRIIRERRIQLEQRGRTYRGRGSRAVRRRGASRAANRRPATS